jgi:hypothetical protein
MAKKTYQSKASREQRLAQNKGVKHGTVRTGAGGRSLRRYDSSTGRWNVVRTATGQGARSSKPAVTSPQNISPASSNGSARISSMNIEGPKRSMARGSSVAAFANNPLGYLSAKARTSGGPALSSARPSFGTPMRLSKSKNKDSRGRDVFRFIPKR